MRFLTNPDKNVFRTLGEGRFPKNGSLVKPSHYAVPFAIGRRTLVFSTLTRQVLDPEERIDIFLERTEFPFDENDAGLKELIKQRFIVSSDADEVKNYIGTVEVLRMLSKKHAPGHKSYVILPTTACNARCFYCYESGVEFKSMDDAMADAAVDYIVRSKSEGSISITWFGGEPLMGERAIDRICAGLVQNGIEFKSSITTNASLITPQLAEKMREVYKIHHAQITLDGRREEYLKRKAYVNIENAYEKVMRSIELLLENGIRVNIRLNVDENNLDDLFLLADELKEKFGDARGVSAYAMALYRFGEGGERDNLYVGIEKLNEKLHSCGLTRGSAARLRTHRCMADVPNGASVIAPDGKLCCCEHMICESVIGSVFDYEKEWELRERFISDNLRAKKRPECFFCPFLPHCTLEGHCPVESSDCKNAAELYIKKQLLTFCD